MSHPEKKEELCNRRLTHRCISGADMEAIIKCAILSVSQMHQSVLSNGLADEFHHKRSKTIIRNCVKGYWCMLHPGRQSAFTAQPQRTTPHSLPRQHSIPMGVLHLARSHPRAHSNTLVNYRLHHQLLHPRCCPSPPRVQHCTGASASRNALRPTHFRSLQLAEAGVLHHRARRLQHTSSPSDTRHIRGVVWKGLQRGSSNRHRSRRVVGINESHTETQAAHQSARSSNRR